MDKTKDAPSVWQDLGALAGLYRNVITMMVQRVRYGPDWQDTLAERAQHEYERPKTRELAHSSRR